MRGSTALSKILQAADTFTLSFLTDASIQDDVRDSDRSWLEHSQVHQAAGMVMVQTAGSIESAMIVLRAQHYRHRETPR